MSRVFLATETALGREVVVKVLAAELAAGVSAERFTREIATVARLQQANIVPLLSAGEVDGLAYYTMPYVRGESLRARMTSGPPLTMAERITILRDVARALAYAHGEGVVHRDIKPENVLLSHGAAMVTDFGIAKAITASRTHDGAKSGTLTQAGGSVGTPAYMAPEQAVGEVVDYRADLYAWGVLAYELLSGAHPFARHVTPQQLIAAHIAETPKPLAAMKTGVPPALAAVVMQCLQKEPARRPASAAEALAALDTVTTPAGEKPWSHASSRPRARAIVLSSLLVVGIAVWTVLHRGGPTATPQHEEQSLAVLPLANLSGNKADDYFGIGLAEEITRALAQSGVHVIGRVSAGALQAKGLDEMSIARELHVGSLLTGAVQRAQGKVRINVSLISAADGSVRWTETYDRPLANVFAVQDEIAGTVATTLLGSLGRPSMPVTRTETTDPEAHALFLQGRVLFNRRGAGPLRQAIALFQQASARDPKYARAQASLAMALAVLPAYVEDSTPDCVTSAVAAAQRAIAIDSTIPESYAALGYAHMLVGELRLADDEYKRAIALDSTLATTWGWYGLLAGRLGDFKAAHERVARARALEPASLIARLWESQILLPERRFAEADSVAGTAIAMDSTFLLAWQGRENALLEMGQPTKGVAMLERHVSQLPPGRPQEAHGMLAYGYALLGRVRDSRVLLDTMRSRLGGQLPPTGAVAATLELLGDHEGAVERLTAADARHDAWLVNFPRQQRYDRLRKDVRAAAILTRLGAR